MTPIKLKAPLKDYLWGGTRLKTDFGKKTDLERWRKAGSFPVIGRPKCGSLWRGSRLDLTPVP